MSSVNASKGEPPMTQASPPIPAHFRGSSPTWCAGCGDFGIWVALQRALARNGLAPDRVVIVFGIGCSGNMANFIRAYGFHGLHGRALPVAEGVRLANHGLPVVVIGGDGDGLGEGMGHFIHAIRSNPNITYILHDNQVYGLTKGQHSPTAPLGFHSPTAPLGTIEEPIHPIPLALTARASFVARGFAGDVASLEELFAQALAHEGFAFVDTLQPCVTYNHQSTFQWYYQRVYQLADVKHDPSNFSAAWQRANEPMAEKVPLGVFYRATRPTLESQQPTLAQGTLVSQQPTRPVSIKAIVDRFR